MPRWQARIRRAVKRCDRAHQSAERQGENVSCWRNAMSALVVVRCGAETEPVACGRVSEAKWEKRWARKLRPD